MPTFTYLAMNSKGEETRGSVEAPSEKAAVALVKDQGLFPTEISEVGSAKGKKKKQARMHAPRAKSSKAASSLNMEIKLPKFMQGKVKTKNLMTFTRQLATLINAGLPLLRGLNVIARQEKHPGLKDAIKEMAESIQSGSTFAEALQAHPKIFDRLYVNMTRAGEIGGVLDVVLLRLAEFMEKMQKIKNKVISAMAYPVIVLIMAMGIVSFLLVAIIPKFEDIFKDLLEGQALPGLTQFVMNTSTILRTRFPVVIAIIICFIVMMKVLRKFDWGRYLLDRIQFRMPLFGTLVQKSSIARLTRTLGTLLNAGVPVLQALIIVRDTSGNEVVAKAIMSVHDAVKEGENIAPPIEATGVFPPMVVSMVEVGEETGALPDMLMRIADNYDDEVDNTVSALSSIIEPILIVLLAIIVGTIVIALFLPLISIIGNLSG